LASVAQVRAFRRRDQKRTTALVERAAKPLETKLRSLFMRIARRELKALLASGAGAAIKPEIAKARIAKALIAIETAELKGLIRTFGLRRINSAGRTTATTLGAPGMAIQSEAAETFIAGRTALVDGMITPISEIIGTTAQEIIGQAIVEGGVSTSELSRRLIGNWTGDGGPLSPGRASRIARTETAAATNYGKMEGYKAANVKRIEWVSMDDGNVRDSHDITGETIAVGETFSNGLQYPLDPAGPPEEVINCRCTALPVFDQGA